MQDQGVELCSALTNSVLDASRQKQWCRYSKCIALMYPMKSHTGCRRWNLIEVRRCSALMEVKLVKRNQLIQEDAEGSSPAFCRSNDSISVARSLDAFSMSAIHPLMSTPLASMSAIHALTSTSLASMSALDALDASEALMSTLPSHEASYSRMSWPWERAPKLSPFLFGVPGKRWRPNSTNEKRACWVPCICLSTFVHVSLFVYAREIAHTPLVQKEQGQPTPHLLQPPSQQKQKMRMRRGETSFAKIIDR